MPSVQIPFVPPALPIALGIPALIAGASVIPGVAAVVSEATGILGLGASSRWGIYGSGGAAILPADAVDSVEYAQDFRISDYPQEQGAFASYNKVQVPFTAKVGFLVAKQREPFLQGIGQQLASLSFFSVVTPEISYPSANLVHYGYRRTSRNGVTMILVEVWCEEVRVTGTTTQSSNTQSQNGQSPQNTGTVSPDQQTTTPTNTITGNLTSGLPSPPGVSPSTSLPTPNIPSAFFDSSNLPQVPDEVANLNINQQSSAVSFGLVNGATSATVQSISGPGLGNVPPDSSGVTIESIEITGG